MEKVKSIWIDGSFQPYDDAQLHFYTHTLHYGLGVFEGIRAYATDDGKPAIFRLEEHIRRLFESAKVCLMEVPFTETQVREACCEVLRENGLNEAYIRPLVWMGEGPMGIGAVNATRVGVGAFPWGPYLGEEALEKGIQCNISSLQRISHTSHMTRAKICGQYVNSILAKRLALRGGYDEALLTDGDGHVAEGTGENIFCVRDGRLETPPRSASILPGITRETVMTLAEERKDELGITIGERLLPRDDLYLADEVFLTGTAAEVTPVREIDGRVIGAGVPGPVTKALAAAYGDAVRGRDPRHPEWLTLA